MATIKMQGNASGSGSVTLTAPNTNSARTVTLPDEDIDLGNIGGAGIVKAWVNFDGANTVAIRGSGNVSSITDYGAGFYGPNFSTATSSSNYAASLSASDNTTAGMTDGYSYGTWGRGNIIYTSSTFRFRVGYPANSVSYDQEFVNVMVVE